MPQSRPDVWFYHLQRQTLEEVLPVLLGKALERDMYCVIEAGSEERVVALDDWLWTFSDETFLPHGSARDGDAELQPIWLTHGPDNPTGATLRFLIDGVAPDVAAQDETLTRVMLLFDGRDEAQLANSRAAWKRLKTAGVALSYFQQDEDGRWQKKA